MKPSSAPPSFVDMVRDGERVTLGDAWAYAASLPKPKQKHPCCACYKATCPKGVACCPGSCVWCSCNMNCCGCVWYSCWLCACEDAEHPGSYSCTDLKSNYYSLVKVDEERGTWAFFNTNTLVSQVGPDMRANCYCF